MSAILVESRFNPLHLVFTRILGNKSIEDVNLNISNSRPRCSVWFDEECKGFW